MVFRELNAKPTRLHVLFLLALIILGASAAAGAEQAPLKLEGRTFVPIADNQSPFYSIRLTLGPPPGQQVLRRFCVLFGADATGKGYWLEVEEGRWSLSSASDGKKRVLAQGAHMVLPVTQPVEVLIKRRLWLVSVAVNGELMLEAQDDSHGAGLVAVEAATSSPAAEPVVQPVEEVNFTENFTRAEGELDLVNSKLWHAARGEWTVHSVREDTDMINVEALPEARRPQPGHSPNPFCVSGLSPDWGLLWGGYWFWDDYSASISVRNRGVGAVGLAFNVVDADNFFLVRWENGARVLEATPIELFRIRGKERTRLAKAWVNGQVDQWYKLGVRTCGTRIQVLLDDAVIMDLTDSRSLGGGVGIYVEGGDKKSSAFFDDVCVRTIRRVDYTNSMWVTRHARADSGSWGEVIVRRPERPDTMSPLLTARNGVLMLGGKSWPAPVLTSTLRVPESGEQVGFLAGFGGKEKKHWRVTLERSGRNLGLDLWEGGENGTGKLASCSDVPLPAGEYLELCADFTREGEVNVSVDGRLWLHASRKGSAEGAPAIFGQKAKGTGFYNLAVGFEREEDKERPPAEKVFQDDPFMKHWSSSQGAWWPAEGEAETFWHVGDFYSRSDVEMPIDGKVMFIHAATAAAESGGYVLKQERLTGSDKPNFYKVSLLRLGKEVAGELVDPADSPIGKMALHKDGPYLWLTAGAKEVFCFRDPEPLRGTRAAVKGVTAEGLTNIAIQRYNVRDYYFEEAPTDWYSVGTWVVTNRFSCDPRWSHMAAVTTTAAALFNKFRYQGDVTIEAFMGMRMRPEGYIRIGDLNLALFTKAFELSSGYGFVTAGWDPFWSERATYLLKGDKQVAFSDRRLLPSMRKPGEGDRILPIPWVPDGRPVHGAWYYMKARKQGNQIEFYVDNHKAYQYVDPSPIDTFSPALWTYDAWIVVAKLKVSYQKSVVPGRLVPPPAEQPQEASPPPAPLLVSTTHPGLLEDFEGGLRGWKKFGEALGGEPVIVRRQGSGHCLKVSNNGAGGPFAVEAPVTTLGLTADRIESVRFDYAIPPDVKVNLYLDIAGQRHFVRLTGPRDSSPMLRRLGEIDVTADGAWHTAQIKLAAAYRRLYPDTAAVPAVERVVFGQFHHGLLDAGIGGNAPSSCYQVDNFELTSAGGPLFEASLPADLQGVAETLVVIDQAPGTVPENAGSIRAENLAAGRWYCHVRAKLNDGTLTGTAHLPLHAVPTKLTAEAITPADGKPWGYGPVRVALPQGALLLLKQSDMKLSVNGAAVPPYPDLFHFDWEESAFAVDLTRAGLDLADGKPCVFELSWADLDGSPETAKAQYVGSLKDDTTPPTAVEVMDEPKLEDFERDVGMWQGSGAALVMRDNSTAATGQWSLMVQNLTLSSAFQVYWMMTGFSAGRVPIVEFDYKVHDAVMVDLMLENSLGTCTIGLTDKSGYGRLLGSVENVHADNRWHHAEVNLLSLLCNLQYTPGLLQQHYLGLGDYTFCAAPAGAYYHLDNFRPVPLLRTGLGAPLAVRSWDAGGIKGYSFLWSPRPDDMPDDTVDTEQHAVPLKDLPAPTAWLHVKACDKAGNWGPVAHWRFLVDSAPPVLSTPSPAAGAKAAPPVVSFVARDESSAIDPDTLKVTIDGQTYTPDGKGVVYDLASGRFTWDWVKGAPADQVSIPNGKSVKAEVKATDFAGNAAQPLAWEWVMDYSQDRYPPALPTVTCETMPVFHLDTFEADTGEWRNLRGDVWGARVTQVVRDAARGDHCLRLDAMRAGGFLNSLALARNYDLTKYPIVCFEYLISTYTRVNLQVQVNGQWYEVLMTGPKPAYTNIGKLEDIKADSKWHVCAVDLLALVQKAQPGASAYTVNQVTFGDLAQTGNKADAYWMVDNFMVAAYGTPEAKFAWQSRDVTGIAGYAAVFDKNQEAACEKTVTTKEGKGVFQAAQSGMYYLRVRACDSAGNWSDTASYPYYVK